MRNFIVCLVTLFLSLAGAQVFAGQQMEAVYPYSLEKREIRTVTGRSTLPLFINLTSFDVPRMQKAEVSVRLPERFSALPKEGWQVRLVRKRGRQR